VDRNEHFGDSISYESYIISMTDQLFKSAEKILNVKGIKKFDAIKGKSITIKQLNDSSFLSSRALFDLNNIHRDSHAGLTNLNSIGCYLSHVALWKKLVESNNDGMLIFESDASCFRDTDFDALIKTFKKEHNGHILFFGTVMSETLVSSYRIQKITNKFYGLHAYYITKEGAKLFLKYAFPIEQQVDSYMSDVMILSHIQNSIIEPINVYVINLCNQNNVNGTSIQSKPVKC
jgi:GR25 family glycosyltransferase involved in LPS biosynthesis